MTLRFSNIIKNDKIKSTRNYIIFTSNKIILFLTEMIFSPFFFLLYTYVCMQGDSVLLNPKVKVKNHFKNYYGVNFSLGYSSHTCRTRSHT